MIAVMILISLHVKVIIDSCDLPAGKEKCVKKHNFLLQTFFLATTSKSACVSSGEL